MIKIIFVCHGNICRSPASEFVFNKMIKERGLDNKYSCCSFALTTEEIGNDIYPPMKESLNKFSIPFEHHEACLIKQEDINNANWIIYMDDENKWMLDRYYDCGKKAICLASFLNQKEVSDPWFHRGFDGCLKDIINAINNFINWLENN